MKKEKYRSLLADIAALVLFKRLAEKPALKSLAALLRFLSDDGVPGGGASGGVSCAEYVLRRWAAFASALLSAPSFSALLSEYALEDENSFTLGAERGELSARLKALSQSDFSRLARLSSIDIDGLAAALSESLSAEGFSEAASDISREAAALLIPVEKSKLKNGAPPRLPSGENLAAAECTEYAEQFVAWIKRNGAGIFGRYRCFGWIPAGGGAALKPVANPDPVRFSDFSGFAAQHTLVKNNTFRFAAGKPANNLLLYGDRGTGKSAAVKAAANEYADKGVRLVEIRKELVSTLPALMETLSGRGLKFILFIDDLSFEAMDDSYTGLKALLEGGVEKLPSNMVVYATSNRRHFVKESSNERPPGGMLSGSLRDFDTLQEQLSLADRFGLTVIYTSPDQEEYVSIAEFIASRRGLLKGEADDASPEGEEARRLFRENALRWERWFNGRSPRTALQYVDWIEGGEGFPWE